jgi:hypothetical protein
LRRVLRLIAAAAALLALTGCRTEIRIGVAANDHGGGHVLAVVTLDKDAQKLVGDLAGQLRVDDLKKAGWTISGPTKVGDNLRVSATKPYFTADGARKAVAELDGGKGLFKNFRITQHKSLLRTTTKFTGSVDLHQGIDAFSDPELQRTLGSPLGATPDEFAKRIGTQLSAALPITVGVILPGTVDSNAPIESGNTAAWHPKLGDKIELVASAKQWHTVVVGVGAFAVFALGGALIFGLGGRRKRDADAVTPSL